MRKSTLDLTTGEVNYLFNMFKNFDNRDIERVFDEDKFLIFKNSDQRLITHVMPIKDILKSIENITDLTLEEFGKYRRSYILDDSMHFYELIKWFYRNDFIREETYVELTKAYDTLEEYDEYLYNRSVVEEYESNSPHHDIEDSKKPVHAMILEDMDHPTWRTSLVSLWNVVWWVNPTENEKLCHNKRKVVDICQSFVTLKRFELSFDKLLYDIYDNINRVDEGIDEGKLDVDRLMKNLEQVLNDLRDKIGKPKKRITQEEFADILEDCVKKIV